MSKSYRPYDPDQQLLLPQALQEWLPDDHLAYFISDVVDQLELSEITARYERERRGGPPYHPRMMVKVLVYGYWLRSVRPRGGSPQLCTEDIAFRCWRRNTHAGTCPRTVTFRKDNLKALSGLFVHGLCVVVPTVGSGEAGTCGVGWHEGEGERIEAQGDELRTDEREGSAVIGGGG